MSEEQSKTMEDISTTIYTRIAYFGYINGKETMLHITDTFKGFVAIPNVQDSVILTKALDQPIVENKRMHVARREFLFTDRPYMVFIKIFCYSLEANGPSFWVNDKKETDTK